MDKKTIPCKTCITYAICKNKEQVECSILYKHYVAIVDVSEIDRPYALNVQLLFMYAIALGHSDWTLANTRHEIWAWTPVDELRPEPHIPDEILPGRDY